MTDDFLDAYYGVWMKKHFFFQTGKIGFFRLLYVSSLLKLVVNFQYQKQLYVYQWRFSESLNDRKSSNKALHIEFCDLQQ